MAVRRIATGSRELWERWAAYASPSYLAKIAPPSSGGLTHPGWQNSIRTAKSRWHDLPWIVVPPGARPKLPDEPLPEPVYADELGDIAPLMLQTQYVTGDADLQPLTIEDKVARDREVHRLKERVSELEAKYREATRDHLIEDALLSAFAERVPCLEPAPHVPRKAAATKRTPETVVALWSDFHIGEVVSGEETDGLAWYDFETFAARFQKMIDTSLSICFDKLTGYNLPRLEVFMLGDMVSGVIHDELVETSDGTVMEWLLDGAHVVAQGLRDLAAEFPEVRVTCVVGNHGRLSKQVRFKKRYVNFDYLFYRLVALELRDQTNIEFDIPKSFWRLVDVSGHKFLILHGDNIKSWNGIPWYGIERAMLRLTNLLASQRRFFDYACAGHFHNAGTLDRVNGELILNGSMPGGNEFSIGALFASTKPRQLIFGVHPDKGKTWSYGIGLSDVDDEIRYKW